MKNRSELKMSVHYYSGFFEVLPKKMVELLQKDIVDRKSIVMIDGGLPQEDLSFAKNAWLDPAGIIFDEYHFIDENMPKEKAHLLLRNASVILVLGGYTKLQNNFLTEYELATPIKESEASVVIGISAGAKNMSSKAICMKNNGYTIEETNGVYDGLRLDAFCFEPYFSLDNEILIKEELLPLSHEVDVYAVSNWMRVKDGEVLAFGDAYRISKGKLEKLKT